MSIHRINLRGPWDYEWLTPNEEHNPPSFATTGTVQMPKSWQAMFGSVSGGTRFQRKFHRPTNLEPHERVFIVLTEVRGSGSMTLNKSAVGEFDSTGTEVRFDVTTALDRFNVLMIEIEYHPSDVLNESGGLFGVVAIEIQNDRT